jgi:hypothetical protein
VPLPIHVLQSQELASLRPKAVKLLVDLLAQHRRENNGDLCASWTLMRKRGWRSKETLSGALAELREKGWLTLTRQGGRHKASLYAVSFFSIDYCGGKLDVDATASPSNAWRRNSPPLPSLTPTRWPLSKEVRACLPHEMLRKLARQSLQTEPDCNGKQGNESPADGN